jgi:hypothetical protein
LQLTEELETVAKAKRVAERSKPLMYDFAMQTLRHPYGKQQDDDDMHDLKCRLEASLLGARRLGEEKSVLMKQVAYMQSTEHARELELAALRNRLEQVSAGRNAEADSIIQALSMQIQGFHKELSQANAQRAHLQAYCQQLEGT